MAGYKAEIPSVGGKAPKWVVTNQNDSNDFYIAKLGATNVTEFSSGISANSGLTDITAGPDGNVWFTGVS